MKHFRLCIALLLTLGATSADARTWARHRATVADVNGTAITEHTLIHTTDTSFPKISKLFLEDEPSGDLWIIRWETASTGALSGTVKTGDGTTLLSISVSSSLAGSATLCGGSITWDDSVDAKDQTTTVKTAAGSALAGCSSTNQAKLLRLAIIGLQYDDQAGTVAEFLGGLVFPNVTPFAAGVVTDNGIDTSFDPSSATPNSFESQFSTLFPGES